MSKQRFVIELDTKDLTQDKLDQFKNDIVRNVVEDALGPGNETALHFKASHDKTTHIKGSVSVGQTVGDIGFNADDLENNRLENLDKLRASIETIESSRGF